MLKRMQREIKRITEREKKGVEEYYGTDFKCAIEKAQGKGTKGEEKEKCEEGENGGKLIQKIKANGGRGERYQERTLAD